MHSEFIINGICGQLKLIYDRISGLTNMTGSLLVDKRTDILDKNEEMMVAELEQAQKLTLALTREILGSGIDEGPGGNEPFGNLDNTDGDSAFSEGELTENLGDKTDGISNEPLEGETESQPDNKE